MHSLPRSSSLVNLLNRTQPKFWGKLPFMVYDVETYKGYFCVAFSINDEDGNELEHGVVETAEDVWDIFQPVLQGTMRLVGFNNSEFDDRIMSFVLSHIERTGKLPSSETIHLLGNLIISGQNADHETRQLREQELAKFGVTSFGTFLLAGMSDDARLMMGTRTPSLKVLESRMGSLSIEETPIPFDTPHLTDDEKSQVASYCLWDTRETRKAYLKVREQADSFGTMAEQLEAEIAEVVLSPNDPIELLETALSQYTHPEKERVDAADWLGIFKLRTLPQSQFAERYCRIQAFLAHYRHTGEINPFVVLPPSDDDVLRHPREEEFTPDAHIPLAKHYQVRRWVREGLGKLRYAVHERGSRGGKPQFHIGATKADTADAILLNNVLYRVGVGGIHSVDPAGIISAGEGEELVDLDVTSFYPQLIINLSVAPYPWPTHLQEAFLINYKHLMEQRVALKSKIKKSEGAEKATAEALAYVYKIVLNSVYGKFRDRYSVLWSPKNTPRVTLHGQLFLLHLIERVGELGGVVVSANTDGFTIVAKPEVRKTLLEESVKIGYTLEETQYTKLVRESISCYAALKPTGELKRKGAMETTPSLSAEVKRPVVYDAVIGFLLHGVPVETTVREALEAKQWVRFTMMRKTTSRSLYTMVSDTDKDFEEEGKVFRFLWANRGWVDRNGRGSYRLTKKGVATSHYGDEWDIMPCRNLKHVDPNGIDVGRYAAKAWEVIAKILPPTRQEEFLPTQQIGDVSPRQLWEMGVYPAANRGKVVISGKRFSTIQPWGSATTLGCYTGKRYGRILVIDVDDPEQFRKFLSYQKGRRKSAEVEFELPAPLPETLVSFKSGGDAHAVRRFEGRGKLVFTVPETDEFASCDILATLNPTAFNTKVRSKLDGGAGFDIFYGDTGGHPSLSGARDDGSEYRVVGSEVAPLPAWLWSRIESHFSAADRQRIEVRDTELTEDDELLSTEEDEVEESAHHQFDYVGRRNEDGIEFSEDYSDHLSASHRGATWMTILLEKAVQKAGEELFPLGKTNTKSHFSIPAFSPHVVEIECWGEHSNNRGRKTIVAVVEDRETGDNRVVYKCLASSCQSSHHQWRGTIQKHFDALLAVRRERVLERIKEEDDRLDDDGSGGSKVTPGGDPVVTPPSHGEVVPPTTADLRRMSSTDLFQKPKPQPKAILKGHNEVAQWLLQRHLVGAFHQPTGSGKGYGTAQVCVENLLRGKLTVYVAPRNAQVYTFAAELRKAIIRYRVEILERIGDIGDLTGAKFVGLGALADGEFAQTIMDKLVALVNADNHNSKISLTSQLIILTNPYYFGQKGDSGKAHPFSFQLEMHSTRLGREGILIFDEYHDTVREAWSKSMSVSVRYKLHHSESYAGMIPSILSRCPGKGSGWSGKSSGDCSTCLSCSAPASLKSRAGVLAWKELRMVGQNDDHPFGEAEDAPSMELGETSEWVPITQGKTQCYTSVYSMLLGKNLNWDDAWHEGKVARGWEMNTSMWVEEKQTPSNEIERRRFIYLRDKAALAYNLKANFGIRAVMDAPLNALTGEPILTKEELEDVLAEHGKAGITYPRNACLSPEIQWIDATALYRIYSFLEAGWKVRFLSATVSDEALDHVKILADSVAERMTLEEGEEFSLETRSANDTLQLEEVLVVGTGLSMQTVMGVVSTRRNTNLLACATDASGVLVPNRIGAFFGRQVEASDFWEKNSNRNNFHPWWGLHQTNLMQVQHAISETDQEVGERIWMSGNNHTSVHLLSYMYGSLSTGANISNLRTLICDYSTPPPMRSALTPYRESDIESLREDHQRAFTNVVTQVVGRALRFRDKSNRAVILICGVETHTEFTELVSRLPIRDRATEVKQRYIANPNDLMPTMYNFLHRKYEVADGILEDLRQITPVCPMAEVPEAPEFWMPIEDKSPTRPIDSMADAESSSRVIATSRRGRLAQLAEEIPAAVDDGESWLSFKGRHHISKFPAESVEVLKKLWDETVTTKRTPIRSG